MFDLNGFRSQKDSFFANHIQSPLTTAHKRSFNGLSYFRRTSQLRFEVQVDIAIIHQALEATKNLI